MHGRKNIKLIFLSLCSIQNDTRIMLHRKVMQHDAGITLGCFAHLLIH